MGMWGNERGLSEALISWARDKANDSTFRAVLAGYAFGSNAGEIPFPPEELTAALDWLQRRLEPQPMREFVIRVQLASEQRSGGDGQQR